MVQYKLVRNNCMAAIILQTTAQQYMIVDKKVNIL